MKSWNAQKTTLAERLADGRRYASGKTIEVVDLPKLLEAVIRPGDRVCLEGDNQKQADVLAAALANVDPARIHDLHMVQSGVVLPEHLDVFEKGIARKLDYSYSGPQAARVARLLFGGKIELGAVHTYLELIARYFIDLTPQVALIAAVRSACSMAAAAAGAFIATTLAAGTPVALPGDHPAVMDLSSMARVTKLPLDVLEEKAKATPVFAPGLENLAKTGAIQTIWDPRTPLARQLREWLATSAAGDGRDQLGAELGGRPKAAAIAVRVVAELSHMQGV